MIPPCVILEIDCAERVTLDASMVFSSGEKAKGCKVRYAMPSPCRYIPGYTYLRQIERKNFQLEEIQNENGDNLVVVTLDGYPYVYPKNLWEKLYKNYIEPMSEGKPPAEVGLFMHGPAGVGKTSFSQILADITGIKYRSIYANSILSKFVGDSEKNLTSIFADAVRNQPIILVFNDAEWLFSTRSFANSDEAYANVARDMTSILLNAIEAIYRKKYRVLVIANTNVSISNIDPAFLRSGRFGKPIFTPLPDYFSFKVYLEKRGLPKEKAEEGARMLSMSGSSFADANAYVKSINEGKEYKPEIMEYRGYTRLAPESGKLLGTDTIRSLIDSILKLLGLKPEMFRSKYLMIALSGSSRLWIPIINEASVLYGKGAILVNKEEYVDEAVLTANEAMQTLIAVAGRLGRKAIEYIYLNAKAPVVFIADALEDSQLIPAIVPRMLTVSSIIEKLNREQLKILIGLVFAYYGIKIGDVSKIKINPSLSNSVVAKQLEKGVHLAYDTDINTFLRVIGL